MFNNFGRQFDMMKVSFIMFSVLIVSAGIINFSGVLKPANGKIVRQLHAKNTASVSTSTGSAFSLPELGVQLTIPNDLGSDGLEYQPKLNRPVTAADTHPWSTIAFTSKALLALDSRCTADQVSIGMIVQYSEDPTSIQAHVSSSMPLGSHYYGFVTPQQPCSDNPTAMQLQLKESAELKQAFSSLTSGN